MKLSVRIDGDENKTVDFKVTPVKDFSNIHSFLVTFINIIL